MVKKVLYAATIGVTALWIAGCGAISGNSTPEEAYASYVKALIAGDVDGMMKLSSIESIKEQGLDERELRSTAEEIAKGIRFNNTQYTDSMVQNVYKIDENTVAVDGQMKYTNDAQKEIQTQKMLLVLKKEDGVWKTSENDYVKTYKTGIKCGENGGIKICVDSIMQYYNTFTLKGSVENSHSNEYAFGFASLANTSLEFTDSNAYSGKHPQLRDMEANKRIPTGKSDVTFVVGDDVFGGLVSPSGSPKKFSIDGIKSMNGALPSGFDGGVSISIPLQ